MAHVLRMPGISADATEAQLLTWEVAAGAAVRRGDVVATVETDKAVVELEADQDGVLYTTLAAAGEVVAVGGPIAVFVGAAEQVGDEASVLASVGLGALSAGAADEAAPGAAGPDTPPSGPEGDQGSADAATTSDGAVTSDAAASGDDSPVRLFASPIARRMAKDAGVALASVKGTGIGGRIRRRDVELAVAAGAGGRTDTQAPAVEQPAAPAETPVAPLAAPAAVAAPAARPATPAGVDDVDVPHSKVRRAVAAALTASKQTVPHFYLTARCRVDALLALRAQVNAGGAVKVTINDFIVKAAAGALVRVPDMNVVWTPDAVRRLGSVDVAVAMATERGLMTPVVRSAASRSISDVSAAVKDLAARAADGRLRQQELEGGALSISNLGMFGVEEFTAIINPPQAAILAVGAITPHPVGDEDGVVRLVPHLTVVLSVDHRPVDGALAAQWLAAFKHLIENPLEILV